MWGIAAEIARKFAGQARMAELRGAPRRHSGSSCHAKPHFKRPGIYVRVLDNGYWPSRQVESLQFGSQLLSRRPGVPRKTNFVVSGRRVRPLTALGSTLNVPSLGLQRQHQGPYAVARQDTRKLYVYGLRRHLCSGHRQCICKNTVTFHWGGCTAITGEPVRCSCFNAMASATSSQSCRK